MANPILPRQQSAAVYLEGRNAGQMTPEFYDGLRRTVQDLQRQQATLGDQVQDILNILAALGSPDGDSDNIIDVASALSQKANASTEILGTGSIIGGGDLTTDRYFSLDGDAFTPVPSSFYGTNGAGIKGFYTFAAGGGGTVTSVALSLPAIFTVSGSPVTTSGTLTGTLANQSANLVWAGPSTGSPAAPTFRSLVAADIPSLSGTYQPLDADLTAIAALSTTGGAYRTASNTWALRTMTGTANRITVTDGDGVAANPTFDISASYVGQTTITTLGTVATGTWNATNISLAKGGTGASLTDPNVDRMFFWDDSAGATDWLAPGNSLVITTTTLDTIQDIRTTATPQFAAMGLGKAATAGVLMDAVGTSTGTDRGFLATQVSSDATPFLFAFRKARGTIGGESAIQLNDIIFNFSPRGHDGSAYSAAGAIQFIASENWSGTAHGTQFLIANTKNGTTSQPIRFFISNDANIGLNTTSGFGSGAGVVGILNATTVPTTNPTGGGVLYFDSGSFKARTPSGNVATLAYDTKPAVTGSRAGNAALASLLTTLATAGIITDSSTP